MPAYMFADLQRNKSDKESLISDYVQILNNNSLNLDERLAALKPLCSDLKKSTNASEINSGLFGLLVFYNENKNSISNVDANRISDAIKNSKSFGLMSYIDKQDISQKQKGVLKDLAQELLTSTPQTAIPGIVPKSNPPLTSGGLSKRGAKDSEKRTNVNAKDFHDRPFFTPDFTTLKINDFKYDPAVIKFGDNLALDVFYGSPGYETLSKKLGFDLSSKEGERKAINYFASKFELLKQYYDFYKKGKALGFSNVEDINPTEVKETCATILQIARTGSFTSDEVNMLKSSDIVGFIKSYSSRSDDDFSAWLRTEGKLNLALESKVLIGSVTAVIPTKKWGTDFIFGSRVDVFSKETKDVFSLSDESLTDVYSNISMDSPKSFVPHGIVGVMVSSKGALEALFGFGSDAEYSLRWGTRSKYSGKPIGDIKFMGGYLDYNVEASMKTEGAEDKITVNFLSGQKSMSNGSSTNFGITAGADYDAELGKIKLGGVQFADCTGVLFNMNLGYSNQSGMSAGSRLGLVLFPTRALGLQASVGAQLSDFKLKEINGNLGATFSLNDGASFSLNLGAVQRLLEYSASKNEFINANNPKPEFRGDVRISIPANQIPLLKEIVE
ncbi:MAG: hypothetical protein WC492_00285 [Candidatus Micrarchaeia archaeon]